ncbi:MAG: lmo0937 family membrane protein [Acidobacteriota bacterium]|nr:lmo0937 family membrane protein [Acidobacteriota bacterium]
MIWTVIFVLLVLWLLGFALDVAGGLIHVLLVVALIIVVMRLLTGRKVV